MRTTWPMKSSEWVQDTGGARMHRMEDAFKRRNFKQLQTLRVAKESVIAQQVSSVQSWTIDQWQIAEHAKTKIFATRHVIVCDVGHDRP